MRLCSGRPAVAVAVMAAAIVCLAAGQATTTLSPTTSAPGLNTTTVPPAATTNAPNVTTTLAPNATTSTTPGPTAGQNFTTTTTSPATNFTTSTAAPGSNATTTVGPARVVGSFPRCLADAECDEDQVCTEDGRCVDPGVSTRGCDQFYLLIRVAWCRWRFPHINRLP